MRNKDRHDHGKAPGHPGDKESPPTPKVHRKKHPHGMRGHETHAENSAKVKEHRKKKRHHHGAAATVEKASVPRLQSHAKRAHHPHAKPGTGPSHSALIAGGHPLTVFIPKPKE